MPPPIPRTSVFHIFNHFFRIRPSRGTPRAAFRRGFPSFSSFLLSLFPFFAFLSLFLSFLLLYIGFSPNFSVFSPSSLSLSRCSSLLLCSSQRTPKTWIFSTEKKERKKRGFVTRARVVSTTRANGPHAAEPVDDDDDDGWELVVNVDNFN